MQLGSAGGSMTTNHCVKESLRGFLRYIVDKGLLDGFHADVIPPEHKIGMNGCLKKCYLKRGPAGSITVTTEGRMYIRGHL